jgi:hypothetical protein
LSKSTARACEIQQDRSSTPRVSWRPDGRTIGREAFLERAAAFFAEAVVERCAVEDFELRDLGATAVCSYRWSESGRHRGEPFAVAGVATASLLRGLTPFLLRGQTPFGGWLRVGRWCGMPTAGSTRLITFRSPGRDRRAGDASSLQDQPCGSRGQLDRAKPALRSRIDRADRLVGPSPGARRAGETIHYLSVDGLGVAALGLREKRVPIANCFVNESRPPTSIVESGQVVEDGETQDW